MIWPHQLKAGQLGRAAHEGFAGELQAGADAAARKGAAGVNGAKGGGGAEIDEDAGAAVFGLRGHGVGDAVAAQLARVFVFQVDAGLDAGRNDHGRFAKIILAHVLQRVVDGGHNAGHDDAFHAVHFEPLMGKQAA